MSSIKLESNASGTGVFTIASPNSNTNRTLTLPDATGTIITTAGGAAISGTTGTFTGLVDISAAGAGQIQFPATQNASSNANTLDDYEEGTFTYTMPTSTSGSYTVRSGYSTGLYTKIGRFVTVTIRYESSGSSSPVGTLQIAGLPFARAANPSGGFSENYTPFLIRGSTGTTASFYGYLAASSTTIQFYKQGTDGVFSAFTVSDVSGGSGGAVEGGISITYET